MATGGSSVYDTESEPELENLLSPPRSKRAKTGASRYKCKFNEAWQLDFPFVLRGQEDTVYSFYCKVCQKDIARHHQGIGDLKQHEKSSGHSSKVKSMQGSSRLDEMGLCQLHQAIEPYYSGRQFTYIYKLYIFT